MESKKLPVGIEFFEDIIKNDFYYIDKTNLLKDLLANWGKVNLFTRPRRFGKSLTMDMMKCFFETGCDKSLFHDLAISKESGLCEKYMGKFPVISISLKGIKGRNYASAVEMMRLLINREAHRIHLKMNPESLTQYQKETFSVLLNRRISEEDLMDSLRTMSSLLSEYYHEKVIIFIDEYDVPLSKAYDYGYYDQMVIFIRNLFEQGLKTNPDLYFSVLTGCLRVSKESIFTGLNNLKTLDITDPRFDEYFGFTDSEVKKMLNNYHLENYYDKIKEWYDGYHFGNTDVYCPWDVINYCDILRSDPNAFPQPYWINTSSNNILKHFIQKAGKQTQHEIDQLISGIFITKTINQELTYPELEQSADHLWSVLFTTGYLTQRGSLDQNKYKLAIPNLQIKEIFITQIREWFYETAFQDRLKLSDFCQAFKNGSPELIEHQFTSYLNKMISIRDTYSRKQRKENFYHGLLLGLLSSREDWIILSNAESGDGYSDILIEIENEFEQTGIIIELKYAEQNALTSACEKAMKQIHEKRYAQKLLEDGMTSISAYGIACYKKRCRVIYENLSLNII